MTRDASPLIGPGEGPAAVVETPGGSAPIVLVCEHASNRIPAALDGLGLDDTARVSHAAWDIGALELARALSARLDAPLVRSRVSRLVYDCNRPPEAAGAMPERSEAFEVPGNRDLTEAQRARRVRDVYQPFRDLLSRTLDAKAPCTMVTVHSFTPVYDGVSRAVELGLLHDADASLAQAMLDAAPAHLDLMTMLNEPYSAADGVTHTLREHATPRGLPNVMIEVRNDLLGDAPAIEKIADGLAGMIRACVPAVPEAAR
ncbi:N-formylglutamate amidohydrolase [Halovulum sp. GXIMD14794]